MIIKSTIPSGPYQGKVVFTKYNHLNTVEVAEGASIVYGQSMGVLGRTGNAADVNAVPNPHVHVQMRPDTYYKPLKKGETFRTTLFAGGTYESYDKTSSSFNNPLNHLPDKEFDAKTGLFKSNGTPCP